MDIKKLHGVLLCLTFVGISVSPLKGCFINISDGKFNVSYRDYSLSGPKDKGPLVVLYVGVMAASKIPQSGLSECTQKVGSVVINCLQDHCLSPEDKREMNEAYDNSPVAQLLAKVACKAIPRTTLLVVGDRLSGQLEDVGYSYPVLQSQLFSAAKKIYKTKSFPSCFNGDLGKQPLGKNIAIRSVENVTWCTVFELSSQYSCKYGIDIENMTTMRDVAAYAVANILADGASQLASSATKSFLSVPTQK